MGEGFIAGLDFAQGTIVMAGIRRKRDKGLSTDREVEEGQGRAAQAVSPGLRSESRSDNSDSIHLIPGTVSAVLPVLINAVRTITPQGRLCGHHFIGDKMVTLNVLKSCPPILSTYK